MLYQSTRYNFTYNNRRRKAFDIIAKAIPNTPERFRIQLTARTHRKIQRYSKKIGTVIRNRPKHVQYLLFNRKTFLKWKNKVNGSAFHPDIGARFGEKDTCIKEIYYSIRRKRSEKERSRKY